MNCEGDCEAGGPCLREACVHPSCEAFWSRIYETQAEYERRMHATDVEGKTLRKVL